MLLLFSKSPGHRIKVPDAHAVVDIKMCLDVRKPDFGARKQQRRRPVFVCTQSDQRLYCSLIGKYNILTFLMQNIILTSLCSSTDWFESYSEIGKTGLSRDGLYVSSDPTIYTGSEMYLTAYLNQNTLFRRQVYGM